MRSARSCTSCGSCSPSRKKRHRPKQRKIIQKGDYVQLKSLGYHGEVLSVNKNKASVLANGMKLNVSLSDLEKIRRPKQEKSEKSYKKTIRSSFRWSATSSACTSMRRWPSSTISGQCHPQPCRIRSHRPTAWGPVPAQGDPQLSQEAYKGGELPHGAVRAKAAWEPPSSN